MNTPTTGKPEHNQLLNLGDALKTLNLYKYFILGFSILCSIVAAIIVVMMTPIYKAEATLLIESTEASLVSIEEVYGLESASDQYYKTQYEILKSRGLARDTIATANLLNEQDFWEEKSNWKHKAPFKYIWGEKKAVDDETLLQLAVNNFSKNLQVSAIRGTQLVNISYESRDRDLVATVANTHAQQYIDSGMKKKVAATISASNWLGERLEQLREELQESDEKLQSFKENQGIVGTNGGLVLANNELENVANKIISAREKRLELESLYDQVKSIDLSNPDEFELIPTVLQSNLMRDIKSSLLDVQRRQAELSKRYLEKHPRMIAVVNELQNVMATYQQQIQASVNGLENDYRVALANEKSLEKSTAIIKQKYQNVDRVENQLRTLEQDVVARRAVYDAFLARHNEVAATVDLNGASAQIADLAVRPLEPSKPRKSLIVIVTFVLSLFFGGVLAFLYENFSNTIQSPADIENKLNSKLLGIVPVIGNAKEAGSPVYCQYIDHPKSQFSESIRTIRTSLLLNDLEESRKIIAVTSTLPSEGKTSLSLSLAFALAQMENVLLIDADMRRPSIGKALFDVNDSQPGLSELITGAATLDDVIRTYDGGNISVISAGSIPANPLELLGSRKFVHLIEELTQKFDRIIFDTPPVGAVSDAMFLSQLVDSTIYIAKANSTSASLAQNNIKRLNDSNDRLLGVILNHFDVEKSNGYYSQDYGGYYNYSSYGS